MTRRELEFRQSRAPRFEMVEERLVLSADPLPTLVLHGALVGAADEIASYEHHTLDLQSADPLAPQLGSVHGTTGVNYVHQNYGFNGAGQTVAVIDSGIAYDHYNLGRGYGANYRVVGGWDFAENDANPYDDAPAGFHGTHVAGIIGSDHATNSGVAPGVDLVALRVFNDSGSGNFAWVEGALQWVIANRNSFENPITTINMSLGVPAMNAGAIPNWAMLEDELAALNAAGVFVAVSAGNDFTQFNAQGLSYPAVSQYVVPVSSANDAGTALSSFSQRDDRVLVAPGETITSTVPDALFSFNGVANDWASASGTSMASPYVAGASVLVREAFWSIGVTNVNQAMIYDVLFDTADLIYDPITAASYHFIDVDAAIAEVLAGAGGSNENPPPPPTDGDATGNTAQTATQLGTLGHGSSFSGQIANSVDQDFFRFTAAASGRMTLSASPSTGLSTQWQLVGGGGQVQGAALSFDVVSGQSYVVGLTPASGTGSYTVQSQLQQSAVDLGVVDFRQVSDAAIAGEKWYRITAARGALFTVEARSAGQQNIDVQIYTSSQQLLSDAANVAGYARAEATVAAGQTLLVRVAGNSPDTDLTLCNLVSVSGTQIDIHGTSSSDTFTMAAGSQHQITVNGVAYRYTASQARTLIFYGNGASDSLSFNGTSNSETADIRVGWTGITGRNLQVNAHQIETLDVRGGGGTDTLVMHDSAAGDTLTTTPDFVQMHGSGFLHTAYGFKTATVYATGGGVDRATMHDSTGSDTFTARPQFAQLKSSRFNFIVHGFENVAAHASRGTDRAAFTDSAGNDVFTAQRGIAMLAGVGCEMSARGFDEVRATATGGYDTAVFYDVVSPYRWTHRPGQYSSLSGSGFLNYAKSFDHIVTYAVSTQSRPASLATETALDPAAASFAALQRRDAAQLSLPAAQADTSSSCLPGASRAAYFDAYGDATLSLARRMPLSTAAAPSDDLWLSTIDRIEQQFAALDDLFFRLGQEL